MGCGAVCFFFILVVVAVWAAWVGYEFESRLVCWAVGGGSWHRQPHATHEHVSFSPRVRMGRGGKDPMPQISCDELCKRITRKLEMLKKDWINDQNPENTPDKGHYQEINDRIKGIQNDLEMWKKKGCPYRKDTAPCPAAEEADEIIDGARQHQKKQKAILKANEEEVVVDVMKLAARTGLAVATVWILIEMVPAFVLAIAIRIGAVVSSR